MNSQPTGHFRSADEPETLARRLGTTPHLSPLLMKARRFGLTVPEDLEKLAVTRGLRYYDPHGDSMKGIPMLADATNMVAGCSFTNEELALALLSPAAPYSMQRLRMGAAMLAAEENRPEHIARLARLERSETIVRHIGLCGTLAEPNNSFWVTLLGRLPVSPPSRPDVLPHLTRFVAMTGLSRNGKGRFMKWIRPTPMQTA